MKCQCCNNTLSDYESTRRHKLTQEYVDLCTKCLSVVTQYATIPTFDRQDLLESSDTEDFGEPDESTQDTLDTDAYEVYP